MGPPSLAGAFFAEPKKLGYDFFTGVPCSYLKGLFLLIEKEAAYLSAVREDAALGFAAGAWMGGRKPVVFMQNSGLGVSVNTFAQLHDLYRIPVLLVVSWRGYRGADADAPEHGASGAVTEGILRTLGLPHEVIDPERFADQLRATTAAIETSRKPAVLLAPPGVLE
jgi:phosphonopyruvate decarboxylase